MRVLVALALVLALVAVVAVAVVAWINSPAQQEAIRQSAQINAARAAADLRASEERAAWWREFRSNVTPLVLLTAAVLAGSLTLGATGAVGIWLARQWDKRQAQRGRLQPVGGQVSISLTNADQAALMGMAGYWQTQIEQAKRPAFSGAARSERIQISNGQAAPALPNRPAVELPTPMPAAMLPGPVALSNILTWSPSLDRLLIGIGPNGQPLTTDAKGLCHVALVGSTGAGKSNALRLLLAQLLAAGAKAVLADPHYAPFDPDDPVTGDWRPIEARLYRPPAVLPGELVTLFDWLGDELDTRLARRRAGERSGPPLFVAIDELPSIAAKVDQAPDVLTRIVREGRKVGLLAITSSQDFLVKSIGTGGAVRDQFRTAIYGGGDAHSAAVLLDMPRRHIDDGPLGKGTVLLRSAATPQASLAQLPLVTDADLARLLPGSEATKPRRWSDSDGPGRSDDGNEPQNALETPEPTYRPRPTATDRPPLRVLRPQTLTDKARAVGIELSETDWQDLDAMDNGQTPQAIAARETGATEGRPYRRRRDELMNLAEMVRNWPVDDQAANGD